MITYVPLKFALRRMGKPEVEKCPFGERDLAKDECYSGGGQNKCPFFIRYEWCNEHDGCVACNHPPKQKYVQGNLFGW